MHGAGNSDTFPAWFETFMLVDPDGIVADDTACGDPSPGVEIEAEQHASRRLPG